MTAEFFQLIDRYGFQFQSLGKSASLKETNTLVGKFVREYVVRRGIERFIEKRCHWTRNEGNWQRRFC